MAMRHLRPEDLVGKTIDVHSHLGVSLKSYACLEYPYAQSVEGLYYRQLAGHVDVNVVFPFSPDLYFDLHRLVEGTAVPDATPISAAPYLRENRLLMQEIFLCCPELKHRFLPFVSVDPGREIAAQIAALEQLEADYPIYGIKVLPVFCQTPITRLLDVGQPILDFARARDIPFLFHTTPDPREEYSNARLALQVIEQNRDVHFCLAHCIGFHRGYLDQAAALGNVWVDSAAMKIQVDLAAEGSSIMASDHDRFDADYSDYRRVMQQLVEAYPKMMLWGSDSPAYSYIVRRRQGQGETAFVDFRLKGTYEQEVAALDYLSPPLRQAACNGNTLRFLFGTQSPTT
jgi:predicted TIM-barrel fold metal-dependent hydrolase